MLLVLSKLLTKHPLSVQSDLVKGYSVAPCLIRQLSVIQTYFSVLFDYCFVLFTFLCRRVCQKLQTKQHIFLFLAERLYSKAF